MLVFWIVLVRVLAAFCAAESTDPKKPEAGLEGVGMPFSGVGVSGAEWMVDNLLGTRLAEPDLPRLWLSAGSSAGPVLCCGD
jgi:hypothetical protein